MKDSDVFPCWARDPRCTTCVEVVRVFQNFNNVRNTFIYRNWLYVLYLYRASTWYDDLAQYNWLSSLPSDGAGGLRDGARDGALDDNDGCHVQNSIQSQVMVNGILPDPLISKWMNCPKPNFYELCFTIYGFLRNSSRMKKLTWVPAYAVLWFTATFSIFPYLPKIIINFALDTNTIEFGFEQG